MLRLTCMVVVHGVTGLRGPGVGAEGTTGGSDCAWCCCCCESGLLATVPHPAYNHCTSSSFSIICCTLSAFDHCTSSSFWPLYLIQLLITVPHPAFNHCTSSSFWSLYLIQLLITVPHPDFNHCTSSSFWYLNFTFLYGDACCFGHVFNIVSVINISFN